MRIGGNTSPPCGTPSILASAPLTGQLLSHTNKAAVHRLGVALTTGSRSAIVSTPYLYAFGLLPFRRPEHRSAIIGSARRDGPLFLSSVVLAMSFRGSVVARSVSRFPRGELDDATLVLHPRSSMIGEIHLRSVANAYEPADRSG
jgi:hypothetical protein